MRRIDRGPCPLTLERLLDIEPAKRWSSSGIADVITDIRAKLFAAQDGLCAYCEIPLDPARARVEHIHPRSTPTCMTRMSRNYHFEWMNMLLVCGGNRTCDEAKQDKHLCDEMMFPDTIPANAVFAFETVTGRMLASESLCSSNRALAERSIDELCLNDYALRIRREAVIFEVQRRIMVEGESPELVKFEMRREGFPTTVDFVCQQLV